ncbi:unnamed protein product [Oncorhynchus mykiss]|uniref:Uncharacterized protein n=1 Tax=Oncorhynchus mykiss TaxID=8022 RepID=A0A060YY82_ONCMY|nr:unnamed protein product [Oncorhynchus mykiss]
MARSQGVNHELSEVLNQLWSRDTNRLKPGTDYTISLQVRMSGLPYYYLARLNLGAPENILLFD